MKITNKKFAVQLRTANDPLPSWWVETTVESEADAIYLLEKMSFIYGERFSRYKFRAVEITETIRVIKEL